MEIKKTSAPKTLDTKLYADILHFGGICAFILLFMSFFLLLFDFPGSHISLNTTFKHWHLPCRQYIEATGEKVGWTWASEIWKADHLSYLGIALLASLTAFAYLRCLPYYIRKKDFWFVLISTLELAVIIIIASGLLHLHGH